jgi:hypothetical protein
MRKGGEDEVRCRGSGGEGGQDSKAKRRDNNSRKSGSSKA